MIKALSVFFWCTMLCLVTSRIIFQHNLFYTNKFFSGCGSLTFIHVRHAGRHSGQQQRYSTPVCSGPACELYPRCDGGSWAPLLLFGARCFWGPSLLLPLWCPVKGCAGRCCLTLFSSHARSLSIAFAWWWCPCYPDCSGWEDVVWRWS